MKLELLTKIVKEEENKGKFQTIVGEIDLREDNLKKMPLHKGFLVDCGLKGGKLSGGQK